MKATAIHVVGVAPLELNEISSTLTNISMGQGPGEGQVITFPCILAKSIGAREQTFFPIFLNNATSLEELEKIRLEIHEKIDKVFDGFSEFIVEKEREQKAKEEAEVTAPFDKNDGRNYN